MQQVGLIKDTLSVEPDTQKNYLAVGVGKEFLIGLASIKYHSHLSPFYLPKWLISPII